MVLESQLQLRLRYKGNETNYKLNYIPFLKYVNIIYNGIPRLCLGGKCPPKIFEKNYS